MRKRLVLGLSLSVILPLSVVSAQADPGTGKAKGHSGPAMQVQIDKKTGLKINPDDSVPVAATAATITTAAASGLMPLDSSGAQRHADGTISAQLGLRQMKFMTMSIDENGNREVEHQTLERFQATSETPVADEGEK